MAKKKVKRKSRAIVVGHLERVSSKVFDDYKRQITEIIQGHHGVYALYRRSKLYYIGLATDFKRRLNQHLKDRHKGKWTHFDRSIPAPWNVASGAVTLQMTKVPGVVWWDDVSLAWDVEHAGRLAKQIEANNNMLGKAVMGMERCMEALKP